VSTSVGATTIAMPRARLEGAFVERTRRLIREIIEGKVAEKLVCCPVISVHNSCLHNRHLFGLRRDVDGDCWATQGGTGVER
jgi:hypothetical protein